MRLNGHPKVQDTFARVSGYVEQTGDALCCLLLVQGRKHTWGCMLHCSCTAAPCSHSQRSLQRLHASSMIGELQLLDLRQTAADIHEAYTTVHEALRFCAHLRINEPPDNAAVEQFVNEVGGLMTKSASCALASRRPSCVQGIQSMPAATNAASWPACQPSGLAHSAGSQRRSHGCWSKLHNERR